MSLYKNVIAVPVTGGIDTKTTSKLLESGFFQSLRNTVRRKKGAIEKRYGFTALGNLDTNDVAIESGQRLDTFYDDLVLINNTNLYSYIPATDQWKERGTVIPTSVQAKSVIASTGKSVMGDCDYLNGLECYAWEDSRGGIRCSVIDRTTGSALIADTEVTATGTRPKVVAIGSALIITYHDAGDFKCRRITSGNSDMLQTAQTIETGMTDYPYDITAYGGNLAVYAYNTATQVRVGYLLPSGVVGSLATAYADPYTIALLGQNAVSVVTDPVNGFIYVFFHDSAGGSADIVKCQILNTGFTSQSLSTVESIASIRNITGVVKASGVVTVFYEQSGATATLHLVRSNTIVRSGGSTTIGTAVGFKRCVGLACKAFVKDDLIYVGLARESALQSTYFITNSSGFTIARMQASTAAGLTRSTAGVLRSGLSRVAVVDDDYITALSVVTRLDTIDTTTISGSVGINRQTLTFQPSEFDTATLGGNFHIAGSCLLDYDGVRTVEHGFHFYPEMPSNVTASTWATASNSTGTLTSSTTYRFKLVYEWVDAQGQRHQSAPSIAGSVVMGVADDTIIIPAPSLTLTEKSNVRIVAYRTKAGETAIYYRDTDVANNTGADTVTITLTNPDTGTTGIATKEILYTVGGTLDNIAPPSSIGAHDHKGRLFLYGTEDGDIWYSRTHIKAEGVFFSDGLKIRLPDVTAAGTLDDKIVFFQDRGIFALQGEGPVDTGAQNDFLTPQRIPGDVGCTNQKSLVSMPLGLMFKSVKGIYLLDRGLNVKYVGDRVENFNDLTISSAVLLEDNNEVRFTTTDGVCLVYNYYFDEWSTFTNHEAISACSFLNSYCHLKDTGLVNQEVADQYNDNGAVYSMYIETNWFQFAKLQGFQRIYFWGLLGDFVSHHICRVKLAYDFENYYSDPVYFNTESGMGTDTYGTDIYGVETPYGGSNSSVFQFRSKPYRQKCESVKLVIEDVDTITTNGGGSFKLVALSFQIGSKQGLFKMGESKTRGS